ncbi:MAG: elongation factor P [Planctomycetota bacterium]|jgi:elongation factor P
MANVGINNVSRGNALKIDGEIFICSGMEHVKPGKGPAYVQMKLKNAVSGRVLDKRFRSADTVEKVDMDKADATYSYFNGDKYVFMHASSYEEIEMTEEAVGEYKDFLIEGNSVTLYMVGAQVLSLELPKTIVMDIVETEPGIKNASATNVGKPATTNTGLIVTVPPFIEAGQRIKVDTDTGEYLERYNG